MAMLAMLSCLLIPNLQLHAAAPLGTVFTYQGRLGVASEPANGFYDFQFTLHDAASDGSQLGPLVATNAVPVSNGLFMVTLDFESGAFTGDARWLAIEVRTNGSGAFTPLLPRQALTPTPYALYAPGAGTAASVSPIAFLFPGHGSQYTCVGCILAAREETGRRS